MTTGGVLITGTTSGLGKEMAGIFASRGREVIAVNRATLDITAYDAVLAFIKKLRDQGKAPSLFVLNAGINRPDNIGHFDYRTFHEVMATNLDGALTFVSAIGALGITGTRIVCLSSTSNIVPNPGHIGYYLSKAALDRTFTFFSARDRGNSYGAVILGPVHTNIMRGYPPPGGLSGKVFQALAVDSQRAAQACVAFCEGRRRRLFYPGIAVLFYYCVSALLRVVPSLYRGTVPVTASDPKAD